MVTHPDMSTCGWCKRPTHLDLLDAKPTRLAGPIINMDEWLTELCNALFHNEDCDFLACEECYGPGWDCNASPVAQRMTADARKELG